MRGINCGYGVLRSILGTATDTLNRPQSLVTFFFTSNERRENSVELIFQIKPDSLHTIFLWLENSDLITACANKTICVIIENRTGRNIDDLSFVVVFDRWQHAVRIFTLHLCVVEMIHYHRKKCFEL